mgnify:CR=1 FL=1
MTKVISLGGSIVAPSVPDTEFLIAFRKVIAGWLGKQADNRIIFVVGGGAPAREWQQAYRTITSEEDADLQDWIGIMATRLNAQLVKAIFAEFCPQDVVTNPEAVTIFAGKIMVASGWKPGFSTDFDAVILAERFMADTVINLSNIEKVYTADPKKDPSAKPLDSITWPDYRAMVGDEWRPGKNSPFDPVAAKKAETCKLKVICAAGKDLDNLVNILEEKAFMGTTIGPA